MLRIPGRLVVIAWMFCAVAPAHAAFVVEVQHESDVPASWLVGGTVDNVDEGEFLILNGGTPEDTDTPESVRFGPTDEGFPAFPGGMNNHMALHAEGLVDVLSGGSMSGAVLTVTSDDGFRLFVNNVVVAEHFGLRNTDSTSTAPLTLNDGDHLSLLYFNGPGEGNLSLNFGSSTGPLVGHADSGLRITPVPEPAAAGLAALLAAPAVLGRRRRRR